MSKLIDSEYIGIDFDGNLLEAKCLSFLAPDDAENRNLALEGIIRLWSLYSERRSDYRIKTGKVSINGNIEFPYTVLILEQWLSVVQAELRRGLRPVFTRKSETTPFIRGHVNFAEEAVKNFGLIGEVTASFSDLTFDLPALKVIKDAVLRLSELKIIQSGGQVTLGIRRKIKELTWELNAIPASKDPISNAKLVWKTRRKAGNGDTFYSSLPKNLSSLTRTIDLSCDILLGNSLSIGGIGVRIDGIALNMNYLLEFILKESMKSIGGNKDSVIFPEGKINRIVGNQGKWKLMAPDCFGIIRPVTGDADLDSYFSDCTFILDAKHKHFYTHESQGASIDRNDFLQLAAYSSTHYAQGNEKPDRCNSLYGLVSLAPETMISPNLNGFNFVDASKISYFDIEFSLNSIPVSKRLVNFPIKLAKFLAEFGGCPSEELMQLCFRKLGFEILASYFEICSERKLLSNRPHGS